MNTSTYWVYILASQPRGTLYIGVTNNIIERVEQHWECAEAWVLGNAPHGAPEDDSRVLL